VERANRTVIDVAKAKCEGQGKKWSMYVSEIEYAMNTRTSSVTKFTPYELVYGRLPPGPVYVDDILEGAEDKDGPKGSAAVEVEKLKRRILLLQKSAHENQMEAQDKR